MRQIEFRGMRTDGGGMVEGDLIHGCLNKKGKMYILPIQVHMGLLPKGMHPVDGFEVNPATGGQFTGLYDRNGGKIWEVDTVTVWGQDYFIRFNMGAFVAESVTANHLSLIAWEFNGTDVTVTGNLHEPATGRK